MSTTKLIIKMKNIIKLPLTLALVLGTIGTQSIVASAGTNYTKFGGQINYTNPQPRTDNPRINQLTFDFDNSYDYGACLDAILLAYENRNMELAQAPKNDCAMKILSSFGSNLSRDTALELIHSADTHATEVLGGKLYPSFGLRRRVAISTGYVYDIDVNNSEIMQYVISQEF